MRSCIKHLMSKNVWSHFKHLEGSLDSEQTSCDTMLYLALSSLSSQITTGLPLSPFSSRSGESVHGNHTLSFHLVLPFSPLCFPIYFFWSCLFWKVLNIRQPRRASLRTDSDKKAREKEIKQNYMERRELLHTIRAIIIAKVDVRH